MLNHHVNFSHLSRNTDFFLKKGADCQIQNSEYFLHAKNLGLFAKKTGPDLSLFVLCKKLNIGVCCKRDWEIFQF